MFCQHRLQVQGPPGRCRMSGALLSMRHRMHALVHTVVGSAFAYASPEPHVESFDDYKPTDYSPNLQLSKGLADSLH